METLTGMQLLQSSQGNKSTAFSQEERQHLGLEGLIPDKIESIDLQVQRVLRQLGYKTTDYERYIFLMSLLDHNETLFYKTIMSNPAYFLPIIYDPTIGEACLKFDVGFRQSRGMYLSIEHKGRVKQILQNWPQRDVRFICVTDGGRILGLGDLGANGMGIPIGKLQLYTAAAAVPPHYLLPLYLDAGTNNASLLNDPLYLGLKKTRPSQKELYVFVDEFVDAVQQVFPHCCIHFEDWTGADAVNLLERYRDKVCCFNDDIQGTAAIAVSGLINAIKIKKEKFSAQRILFLGAGSAGIGIANLIVSVMDQEGLTLKEARSRIALFDIHGLIESSRSDLLDFQRPYAHAMPATKDFVQAITTFKPTALIGVSTVGGTFTQPVIEAMTRLNARPIIFALSNPTEHAECTPEQAYHWSQGKALYAAGVQFDPVSFQGKLYYPGQANNFYIFPALGMAILATQAKRVNDALFIEAAHAIADEVSADQLASGCLYPQQSAILEVELKAAERIAKAIFDQDLARISRPKNIGQLIEQNAYRPEYAVSVKFNIKKAM
jgi:malate dehydrogenase (oxaloacetate-decarboxylating)(NADP+)